jgi:hypothetical protein
MSIAAVGDAVTVCGTVYQTERATVLEALLDDDGAYYWVVGEGNKLFTVRFEECIESTGYAERKKKHLSLIAPPSPDPDHDLYYDADGCPLDICVVCGNPNDVWENYCTCEDKC